MSIQYAGHGVPVGVNMRDVGDYLRSPTRLTGITLQRELVGTPFGAASQQQAHAAANRDPASPLVIG